MKLIGTIWGVIAFAALVYGCLLPFLEKKDNQNRYDQSNLD